MEKIIKSKAPYLVAVAVAFFVYEFYLLVNSFGADYRIYATVADRGFSFWGIFWLSSELVGEVGLIVRFAGACFFLALAIMLLRRKEFVLAYLRKGIFLEAIQYLLFVPFITYLLFNPNLPASYDLAAASYIIQLALITPVFILLFSKLRRQVTNKAEAFRWIAIASVSFVFALWAKHFVFSLYALPIDFQEPVLLLGFLNSSLTMLLASLLLLAGLLPIIKGKSLRFNVKAVGFALVLVGVYFVVYLLISLVNASYLSFLTLTELWAISLAILGYSLIRGARSEASMLESLMLN